MSLISEIRRLVPGYEDKDEQVPWWMRRDADNILWRRSIDASDFSGPNFRADFGRDQEWAHFCWEGKKEGPKRLKRGGAFLCCNGCGADMGRPTMDIRIGWEELDKWNKEHYGI